APGPSALLAYALLMRVLRCSAARPHSDHLGTRCLGRFPAAPLERLRGLLLQLLAQRLLARGLFGRKDVGREVPRFEHLADLDLSVLEWDPRGPFDRLFLRLHLDQPETGDQLPGFRERSVGHGTPPAGEQDASALRARLEPVG